MTMGKQEKRVLNIERNENGVEVNAINEMRNDML